MKKIKIFLHLLGSKSYDEALDKPSLWQWAISWRVGPGTAWRIAKTL